MDNDAETDYVFDRTDYPFLQDVNETLQQASTKAFAVEEIIFSLQITMSKYALEKLLQKKESINHYIKTECKKVCSITLDDEKLRQLWIR